MKRILYIARNEWYSLFYSPIAWLLMIVFLILVGTHYLFTMKVYFGFFQQGGYMLQLTNELTDNVLDNRQNGYLFRVIDDLYIFFPLITMGLFSREFSTGTIRLLYSSPVRVREMVLGKFLAMVYFSIVLVLLVMVTLGAFSFALTRPDYGHMLAAALGIFFVLCLYAAVGLFISSLTSYYVVAAIATLAVLALFSHAGEVWQDIDTVRNITAYLNIGQKSADLLEGLYNSRDIFYFINLTATFLLFAMIRIKTAAQSVSNVGKFTRYIAVLAGLFVAGYLTSGPGLNVYHDFTRDHVHSISRPTQATLARLDDGPLEITAYWNLLTVTFGRLGPKAQIAALSNVWEPYIRWKPDIRINVVYYYNTDTGSFFQKLHRGQSIREMAEHQAKSYGVSLRHFLSPAQVKRLVNVDSEENRNFFVLKYKGRTAIARTFDDIYFWPTENEIAATLNRLAATPPRIGFLNDEIERGPFSERPRDYKALASTLGNRNALVNQGFDVDTLSLLHQPAPQGLAALVIADPRIPLSPASLSKIRDYIRGGGNLFIAAEPDRAAATQPLLDQLGITIRGGLVIQPNPKYSSDCALPYLTDAARNLTPMSRRFADDELRYTGDSLFRVAMIGTASLAYKPVGDWTVRPLLTTDKALAWNRLAPISPDSLQRQVGRLSTDEHGSFITALLMHRTVAGTDQRVVVTADADFLTENSLLSFTFPRRYNFNFASWCFSYFSYGHFPANTVRPETDNEFRIKPSQLRTQAKLLFYYIPVLIAVFASIVLIRRKRK